MASILKCQFGPIAKFFASMSTPLSQEEQQERWSHYVLGVIKDLHPAFEQYNNHLLAIGHEGGLNDLSLRRAAPARQVLAEFYRWCLQNPETAESPKSFLRYKLVNVYVPRFDFHALMDSMAVLKLEGALQEPFPVKDLKNFADDERSKVISRYAARLFALPKSERPTPEQIVRAIHHISTLLFQGPYPRLGPLFLEINRGSRGVFERELRESEDFPAKERRLRVNREFKDQVGSVQFRMIKRLSEDEPRGPGYLTFVAVKVDKATLQNEVALVVGEQRFVVSYPKHPLLPYFDQNRPEGWLPFHPTSISGGVVVSPQLFKLSQISRWKVAPLSADEKAILDQVSHFLWEMFKHGKLPTLKALDHVGMDLFGGLFALKALEIQEGSYIALEALCHRLSNENPFVFNYLMTYPEWKMETWELHQFMDSWLSQLVSSQTDRSKALFPKEKPHMTTEENLAADRAESLFRGLVHKGVQPLEAAFAVKMWYGLFGVVQTKWERAAKDLEKLVVFRENPQKKPLPIELEHLRLREERKPSRR